jgi:hypothetical protein
LHQNPYFQVLNNNSLSSQVADFRLNFYDFETGEQTIIPNLANGTWANPQPWTGASPPGNGSPAFLVAPHTYVEWSGNTLYLTQDSGQSWPPVGTLPANITQHFDRIQIANVVGGAGPVVYEAVTDDVNAGAKGIAILAHPLPPPSSPASFNVQTLGGVNDRGLPSGLKAIWGNCFGFESWDCTPVYSADPSDYRHIYAVDRVQQLVMVSWDAGISWNEDIGLTTLVTAAAGSMEDSTGNSQVHIFSFDLLNPSHILVGTDQAGIFASANGGVTWQALPGTSRITAITSFFFDDRTNTIFVGFWCKFSISNSFRRKCSYCSALFMRFS